MMIISDKQNPNNDRRTHFGESLMATACRAGILFALASSQLAYAQTSGPEASDSGHQGNEQASDQGRPSDIVVTGTKVIRNGYKAPTPVTVISTEEIARDAPTQITDFLGKTPQFFNNNTPRNNANGTGDASAGSSTINLRSMGASRSLVLLDGVRVGPGSVTGFFGNGGAVDISAFPDALISRIDVVTGGASAPYGSDALVGVVNFILDKNYTGIKASVTGSITTHGDDPAYLINLTAGTKFADERGHLLISGSTNYNKGLPNGGRARAWVSQKGIPLVNPAYASNNGQPYYLFRYGDAGSSTFIEGGLISAGPLRGIAFGPGGVPRQFVYGNLIDASSMIGGEAELGRGALSGISYGINGSLDTELSRQNLFTRVSYDIKDNIEAYAQFMYSRVKTLAYFNYTTSNSTIDIANPFIPASVKQSMISAGVNSFRLSTYNTFADGPLGSDNNKKFYHYVVGLKGDFGSSWSWDIYGTRSVTHTISDAFNNLIPGNLARAVDVVTNPATGLPICRSTLTNPTNGCLPLNLMGVGLNSPAAIHSVFGTSHLNQTLTENVLSATVRGTPFSLWAGEISVAVGLEHRTEASRATSSALDLASAFASGNFKPTIGSYRINEGFFETIIPLAKDAVWARSMDLNAALRITDYSTSGTVVTWKVGATWDTPISGLRFRATRSRDIRSPNLGELYSAGIGGSASFIDPQNGGISYPVLNTIIGNSTLAPEEADSIGGGAVFQPAFFEGFSTSLDYYKIKIGNAISRVSPQQVIDLCFAGSQFYCSNITRNSSGFLTFISTKPGNTAFAGTSGLDFEASYTLPFYRLGVSGDGSLRVRALANRVLSLKTVTPDGLTLDGLGVLTGLLGPPIPAAPQLRYNVTVGYDSPKFSASWTGRGFSSGIKSSQYTECTSGCPPIRPPYYTIENNKMPAAFYMDVSLGYHMELKGGSRADFIFSVENIANKDLSGIPVLGLVPTFYDTLGRIFRASINVKM